MSLSPGTRFISAPMGRSMPTYWSTGRRMYSESERPARSASSGSSTGTFTRSAHRRLLGNTSPDISSMVTMRVSASASAAAVEVEVEDALARVERARRAACARNEATSRRVDASARARGAALACAERTALIADIARVVTAECVRDAGARCAAGARRGLRADDAIVRLSDDSITFPVRASRGDSARDGRSRERAIVARSSGTRAG